MNDYYDALDKEQAIAFARASVLAEKNAYVLLERLRAEWDKEHEKILQEASLTREGLRLSFERETRYLREEHRRYYERCVNLDEELKYLRARTWWHLLKETFRYSGRDKK